MRADRGWFRWLLLAAASLGAWLVPAGVARADGVTFVNEGLERFWVAPPGIVAVKVEAVGGHGGDGFGGGISNEAPGGAGARVRATLLVTPGQTFYIRVGGVGGPSSDDAAFNGGGAGGQYGAGGGGATDIRTVSEVVDPIASLNSRILVAAGGGGGGGGEFGLGAGGAAGMPGLFGAGPVVDPAAGTGGYPGTATGGGAGGTGGSGQANGGNGENGALGVGGNSNANFSAGGGGGGGGLYGGGAGGTGGYSNGHVGPGGGGGGGSSLVPAGGTFEIAGLDEAPQLTLTYVYKAKISLGNAIVLGPDRVALSGIVDARDGEVSAYFEYGPTEQLGEKTPASEPSSYILANAELTGLKPGTTYFYRLVAKTDYGEERSGIRSFTLPNIPLLRLQSVAKKLDRKGRVVVRMRCVGQGLCQGRLYFTWPGGKSPKWVVRVAGGSRRVVRVRVPSTVRKRLRKKPVTLRARLGGLEGTRVSVPRARWQLR